VGSEEVLGSAKPLGLRQARGSVIDLAEELRQEARSCVRGDFTRIVPGVHLVSGQGRTD
jgi:hypothetical protein